MRELRLHSPTTGIKQMVWFRSWVNWSVLQKLIGLTTHYNTLKHTCSCLSDALRQTAKLCNTRQHFTTQIFMPQWHTAMPCNTHVWEGRERQNDFCMMMRWHDSSICSCLSHMCHMTSGIFRKTALYFGKRALQHTATVQHTVTHCNTPCHTLEHTATHCHTLRHTAAHCSTLQHTATHCKTLQHTVTHRSTLQHTAIHCNTL